MQKSIGSSVSQPLMPTPSVAPMPKTAPTPSPAPTTAPTPTSAPATAPTTLAKSEATVVEESIKTTKPTALASLFGVVKETGVDITSDLSPSSEPAMTLKDSQSKLSKAFGSFKDAVKAKLSAVYPTDGQLKVLTLTGRLFDASASIKEKILGLSFREFARSEFNTENTRFLDGLMGVSEMEPGSKTQDQAIESLYNTFIKESAVEVVNIGYYTRKEAKNAHTELSAAKRAYAQNPSEENLTSLNLARTKMLDSLMTSHHEIAILTGDTHPRFLKSELLADMQALTDGSFSVSKDKSLGKALYLAEQMDAVIQKELTAYDFISFEFKTEAEVKSKKSELESQIKALRYGDSSMDKIKHGIGRPDHKVLSAKQIELLKSLEDQLPKVNRLLNNLSKAAEARHKTLEDNIQLFKTFQTQLADPGFLTQLKTEPLE